MAIITTIKIEKTQDRDGSVFLYITFSNKKRYKIKVQKIKKYSSSPLDDMKDNLSDYLIESIKNTISNMEMIT